MKPVSSKRALKAPNTGYQAGLLDSYRAVSAKIEKVKYAKLK
jgi:hypothetical protein